MVPFADMAGVKVTDYKLLKISSTAFTDGGMIPSPYTCDGEDINPPLDLGNIPVNAISLAIIVEDPDAPNGNFYHWLVWNIPVTHHITEGEQRGQRGRNDFGREQYNGPCPPAGVHRYYFKVYALDAVLDLPAGSTTWQLERAISDHIIAFGVLTGMYKRKRK